MMIVDGHMIPETVDDVRMGLMLSNRFIEIDLPADTFKHEQIAEGFFSRNDCMMKRDLPDGNCIVSILRKKENQT